MSPLFLTFGFPLRLQVPLLFRNIKTKAAVRDAEGSWKLGVKSSIMKTVVQMTSSPVIDKMVVDEGRALQPCRYRLFTHMSCIILYPYST